MSDAATSRRWFWLLGALTALLHVLGLLCLYAAVAAMRPTPTADMGRAAFFLKSQLACWLTASACWLGLLWWLRGRAIPSLFAIALLGLVMRLPGLGLPVVHSDDVYRYLWDGAAQRAQISPYVGTPEAPAYDAVRANHPQIYARINHRHLPTIYPPAAQVLFSVAARLGDLPTGERGVELGVLRWKILCGLAELALCLILLSLLRQESGEKNPRWLALWVLSPLPAVEIWVNGHLEGVALLLLASSLLLLHRQRAAIAGALWILAALIKPLALAVVPGLVALRPNRRTLVALGGGALITAVLVWGPYRGEHVAPSLGEYGRRWRSNDGAYAILHRTAELAVSVAYAPPYYDPWKRPRIARFMTGRDRDTVWPDELANFLARGTVFLLLCGLLAVGVKKRLSPSKMALLLLSGYALLTPTLHPWYLLWPLLFSSLCPQAAAPMLVLAALSPLAYLPLCAEWLGQPHSEPIWSRLLQHGASWIAIAWSMTRRVEAKG